MTPIFRPFREIAAGRFNPSALVLIIMLSLGGLTACGESHAEARPEAVRAAAPVSVRLVPVTEVPSDLPLRATGRVTHARDTKPSFKTGGLIAAIHVDEGMRVEAGQLLAELDTTELDAGLAGARAGLAKARRDLARASTLAADNALPAATKDDAATAAAVARAQVAGIAWNRSTTRLVATHAGIVIKRLAEPGEVVGPGQPIVVIGESAADEIRVEIGLPARDRDRVTVGTHVDVRLDGSDSAIPAEVVELAPTLIPGTDRIAVTVVMAGDPALTPRGLTATATFAPRPDRQSRAIPIGALVEGQGRGASVWVPGADGGVMRRDVTIGAIRPDGLVTIVSGLDGVTEVVDAGQAWLDAEARITVVADTKAAEDAQ